MGGIGFFLGGIGPDGHIAFNVRGSRFYSVTRLTGTNYETQAAAADRPRRDRDLPEPAGDHDRPGDDHLQPHCTALIIAAGDAKASVVARAVEEPKSPQAPASVLQDLEGARFYVTRGAASGLTERRYADLAGLDRFDAETADDIAVGVSLGRKIPLHRLTDDDLHPTGSVPSWRRSSGRGPGPPGWMPGPG